MFLFLYNDDIQGMGMMVHFPETLRYGSRSRDHLDKEGHELSYLHFGNVLFISNKWRWFVFPFELRDLCRRAWGDLCVFMNPKNLGVAIIRYGDDFRNPVELGCSAWRVHKRDIDLRIARYP